LIAVSGNATFSGGSLAVSVLENPVGKTYDLLTYGGTLTGTPSVTTGDIGRLTASVTNGSGTNDKVTLGFTGSVGNLTWKGNVDSNWNNNSTANFDNGGSGDFFRIYDNVTFDNTATSFAPTIATSFQASTVAFNNTTDYTLSGAGGLTGTTSITKAGTGTVTISTPNTYTGNVTITGGTLKAGSATALGAAVVGGGTYISGGGTLDINAQNLGGELVTIEGTGVGGNGAIVNSGASQTQALRFVTLSDDASIGGTGRWDIRGNTTATLNLAGHKLTKTGANYIAIVAANVTSGDIDVNEGTLGFSTTTTVNGTGTVKVNSGGNLEIAYGTVAANITRNIVLNGGTLSSVSTASAADSNISITASSVISGGSLTLNGDLTESGGSFGVTIPSGTVNFIGATSFTGGLSVGPNVTATTTVTLSSLTTAAGKEIRIGNNTASGTTTQTLNVDSTVANSGTLYNGRQGVLNVRNGASWTQSGDMSVNGHGGYNATMNVQAGASFTSTGTNPIQINGAAANSGQALLNISGTGTMTTATGFQQTTTPTTGYGRVTLSGGGTLKLSADVSTLTNQVQFALGAGGGVIDTNGHDATLSGAVTVGTGAALATGISGAGGLTKQGGGILTLSGTNTYTGTTTVSEGTLLVNGSLGNTSTTVASGATLGGGGTLNGSTTISGIHSPGNSPGLQTFAGGLAYTDTAHLNWELIANSTTGRGTAYDGIEITGGSFALDSSATIDLSFGGTVDFLDPFWGVGQEWLVVDLSGAATASDSNAFTFGSITGGSNYSGSLGNFGILRKDGSTSADAVYLTWTPVPEPSTALLGVLGMLTLLRRRRN
jgi:autotransporter-associated beta strand protein